MGQETTSPDRWLLIVTWQDRYRDIWTPLPWKTLLLSLVLATPWSEANNPGVWLMHCHISWQNAIGMGVVFRVGRHQDLPAMPSNFPQCRDFVWIIKNRKPGQKLSVYYRLVEFPIWMVHKFVQTFCFIFKADLLPAPLFPFKGFPQLPILCYLHDSSLL